MINNIISFPLAQKSQKIPTPVEIQAIGLSTSRPWDVYQWLVSVWQKLDPEDIENLGKLLDKNPPTDATITFCVKKMRDRQHG